MPISAINAYLDSIPAILAEQRLVIADGATVPHLKNPKPMLRAWERSAYGDLKKHVASPAVLAVNGIGVKHVKKSQPG